jgi:hypothetical protein
MTEPNLPGRAPGPRPSPGMPPARPGQTGTQPSVRPGPGMPPARPSLTAAEGPRPMRPVLTDASRPMRPTPEARPARVKPDPNPLRMMIGLAGLATASAITSALLPSILPAPVDAAAQNGNDAAAVAPQPSVIHVTRTVQLAPGQTAPPNTSVRIAPQPTPQVHIQIITRQSGKP